VQQFPGEPAFCRRAALAGSLLQGCFERGKISGQQLGHLPASESAQLNVGCGAGAGCALGAQEAPANSEELAHKNSHLLRAAMLPKFLTLRGVQAELEESHQPRNPDPGNSCTECSPCTAPVGLCSW